MLGSPPEPADTEEPYARDVYQNVQVLGDLSIQQFGRLMQSITEWVSPEVENPEPGAPQRGCNYCHNPENYAEDSVYTKVVARRMLQMTKHINEHWTELVGPANRSLVHWIRRLVFRGAWLDQRVKEGELDVVFDDDTHTFGYVQPDRDGEAIELSPEPSWDRVAYVPR